MWIEQALSESLKEDPYIKDGTPLDGGMPHDQSASARVTSNGSVYQKNEVFLEVCGQFESQRGILGFAVAFIPAWLILSTTYMALLWGRDLIRGSSDNGVPNDYSIFFGIPFFGGLLTLLLWLSKKLVLPKLRKDYFTSRRILIRFNRVTRKVYVLAPKFAGGLSIYDWDTAQATLDNKAGMSPTPVSEEEANKGSGRLILGWVDVEARKALGLVFVGRAAGNAAKGRAWWEYIRSYMEDGADSVPKPFPRLWKGVWPQMSLMNMFYLYPERIVHGGPLWWILLPLLAPIDLLRSLLHWIAMLLCVEPKFPPEIENAGRDTTRQR